MKKTMMMPVLLLSTALFLSTLHITADEIVAESTETVAETQPLLVDAYGGISMD